MSRPLCYCPSCYAQIRGQGAPHPTDADCRRDVPEGGWSLLPLKLGEYTLLERLGGGGLGAVYKGTDASGKEVAVKVLKHLEVDALTWEQQTRAFQHEAHKLGPISKHTRRGNRFVRWVAGPAEKDGCHYFVMEYLRPSVWPTLAELPLEGGLPPRLVALIGIELLRAVELLDAEDTVHCDIKPQNVFVNLADLRDPRTLRAEVERIAGSPEGDRRSSWLKVGDLGAWQPAGSEKSRIVRLRAEWASTAEYASPEQIDNLALIDAGSAPAVESLGASTRIAEMDRLPPGARPCTSATDVHAVGTTLYELGTARNPFPGRSAHRDRLNDPPPTNERLPEDLYRILADALAPDPSRRPTPQKMIEDLQAFLVSYAAPLAAFERRVEDLEQRAVALHTAADTVPPIRGGLEELSAAIDAAPWPIFGSGVQDLGARLQVAGDVFEHLDGAQARADLIRGAETLLAAAHQREEAAAQSAAAWKAEAEARADDVEKAVENARTWRWRDRILLVSLGLVVGMVVGAAVAAVALQWTLRARPSTPEVTVPGPPVEPGSAASTEAGVGDAEAKAKAELKAKMETPGPAVPSSSDELTRSDGSTPTATPTSDPEKAVGTDGESGASDISPREEATNDRTTSVHPSPDRETVSGGTEPATAASAPVPALSKPVRRTKEVPRFSVSFEAPSHVELLIGLNPSATKRVVGGKTVEMPAGSYTWHLTDTQDSYDYTWSLNGKSDLSSALDRDTVVRCDSKRATCTFQ